MYSVIKGTGYVLVHTPDMVIHNGATQTTERIVNPESEFLTKLPEYIRSYEDALAYWPNQTYIGNKTPEDLKAVAMPWFEQRCDSVSRSGPFGEIMPQQEFYLLMQCCDVFDLVKLDAAFVAAHRAAFTAHALIDESIVTRLQDGIAAEEIAHFVNEEHAEGLYQDGALVGCVKRAHDIDVNLNAHVMHENLVSKASSVLALLYAIENAGISKDEVEYVIDCAEEACGDMNQRGGGNFAKAAAEIAGFSHATGSDLRAFCAAPAHALIEAASLVAAGTYKTVVVTAGGCTAKLGMNAKDHVKKDMPALEDMVAGFAVVVTADNYQDPIIDLSVVGRHTVGTGSAPQAVISSLVTEALDRAGMKVLDVDKFSPEMQNPDITKPAGAGDVPLSNYKMIGALAAKKGEITPKDLNDFIDRHGMVGWAPTQGHIPSGVPYVGFARQDILAGKINNAMIIGKGSLFLGRMTNLFDGVSFLIRANSGQAEPTAASISEDEVRGMIAKAMRDFAATLAQE